MAINFLNTVAVDDSVLFVDTINDRVGVGTDSPSATLDVVGSGLSTMLRLSNTEANATTKYGAILGRHYTNAEENVTGMLITSSSNSLTGQTVSIGGGITSANAVNEIKFYTAANNTTLTGTERMRIGFNGKVGIGTTNPAVELEVDGSIMASGTSGASFRLNSNTSSGVNNSILSMSQNNSTPYQGSISWKAGQYGGASRWTTALHTSPYTYSYINLPHSSAGGNFSVGIENVERLTIDRTNGNVGIGTTTPAEKLEVGGSVRVGNMKFEPSNAGRIGFNRNTSNGAIYNSNYAAHQINGPSSGADFFEIQSYNSSGAFQGTVAIKAGDVGIGTTSPSEKLEVSGSNTLSIKLSPNNTEATYVTTLTNNYSATLGTELKSGTYNILTHGNGTGTALNFTNGAMTFDFRNSEHMRITEAGNVGIGTTTPDAKLSVVGATSTNDLIGGSINLATSSGWVIPSGAMSTRVGYYGGDFTLNGQAAENGMQRGLGPFNDRQLLWTTTGSTDNDADGGWNKTLTNLDIDSSYLSVVYFKRVSSNTAGSFYHGTGNNILNLNGTANTNPYFTIRTLSSLDQNVWYVSIGVIQSNSDSNTTAYTDISGLYRLDTGAKIANVNTYKFDTDGATLSRGHRAYLYYSTDVNVVAQFANPGFYKIDGDQPKLHDILGSGTDDAFWSANGDDIYNDNSGNVGIGTTSPSQKLDVNGRVNIGDVNYAYGGQNFHIVLAEDTQDAYISNIEGYNIMSAGGYYYGANLRQLNSNNTAYSSMNLRTNGDIVFENITGATAGSIAAATQRMIINSSGNVGIGTTSPTAALDVNGEIAIRGGEGADDARMHFRASDNSNRFTIETDLDGSTSNDLLGFRAAGTDNILVLKGNGNVGIGTDSPGEKLGVLGNIRLENGAQRNIIGPTNENLGIFANPNGSDEGILFSTDNGVTTEMIILNGGNVGIGTTSPGDALEVNGAISTTSSNFVSASTGSILTLQTASAPYSYSYINAAAAGGVMISAALALQTDAGNVGIGTTSPSAKLDVNGDILISNSGDKVFTTDSVNGAFALGDIDALGDEAIVQGDGSSIFLKNAGNTTLTTTVNNRVGIGTTSPGSKLDILGATNTSNSSLLRVRTTRFPNAPEKVVGFYVNTSTERGFISVNQYQTTYSTSSDYRLKENIVPIPNSIERLKELKPCRFNFIQGDPNHVVDGFIAHEAAEVIPEAVTGEKDAVDENNNPLHQGIDQSKVVPLLTAALQEAINKIEQLEKRIQTLENN